MEDYHGKKISDDSTFNEVNRNEISLQSMGDGVYYRVRFMGNYGFMCGEYQEFERYSITHKEAKQIEWSSFGMCGHNVSIFDQQGNLIDEWK